MFTALLQMFLKKRSQSLPVININLTTSETCVPMHLYPVKRQFVNTYMRTSILSSTDITPSPKFTESVRRKADISRRPHWRECVCRLSTMQRPFAPRITCLRTSSAFHDMNQPANQRYDAYIYEISRSPKPDIDLSKIRSS